jgi:hypothetical protein
MLDMSPDADTGGREFFTQLTGTCRTQAAEIVHVRRNKTAIPEKAGF